MPNNDQINIIDSPLLCELSNEELILKKVCFVFNKNHSKALFLDKIVLLFFI